jgi:hypothetical protein
LRKYSLLSSFAGVQQNSTISEFSTTEINEQAHVSVKIILLLVCSVFSTEYFEFVPEKIHSLTFQF